jgi:hypothetical protein
LPLANSFSEIDSNLFVPGNSLRASNVLMIKQNIDEAILTPEYFGVTEYQDGDTVSLPISPVDGYHYSRDELIYIWSWSAVRPNTGSQVRIPVFYGQVGFKTGVVQLACWRLTDHYVDDNNTFCRIKVLTIARREHFVPVTIDLRLGDPSPPTDAGTAIVGMNPYGITFDQGGGRSELIASGESLLMHGVTASLTSMILQTGLPGSTAGCRIAPTANYSVAIKINDVTRGSIDFVAGSKVGTFNFGGPITTLAGDRVEFVGGSADATILGLFWTIAGRRF